MKEAIRTILNKKGSQVYNLPPSATVAECINKMNQEKIGAIAIMEGDRLVGMFTERDILKTVYGKNIDVNTVPISEVMTADIVYARPDTTIEEAMATFTERRFRHLPVMEGEKLVGIISIGDITKWVITNQETEIQFLSDYINGLYH